MINYLNFYFCTIGLPLHLFSHILAVLQITAVPVGLRVALMPCMGRCAWSLWSPQLHPADSAGNKWLTSTGKINFWLLSSSFLSALGRDTPYLGRAVSCLCFGTPRTCPAGGQCCWHCSQTDRQTALLCTPMDMGSCKSALALKVWENLDDLCLC